MPRGFSLTSLVDDSAQRARKMHDPKTTGQTAAKLQDTNLHDMNLYDMKLYRTTLYDTKIWHIWQLLYA